VRWYISNCTYDVCSNFGYHYFPGFGEVGHLSKKSGKRGPITIVTAVFLKRCNREMIDFLRIGFAEFSKCH
jgi:hypothetical protein